MSEIGTLYKWTTTGGEPANGGKGPWPVPNGKPGEWREVEGELVACRNGLHLCRKRDLIHWIPAVSGPELYEAEHAGEIVVEDNKVVVRRARLVRRLVGIDGVTLRLFAADCAESVLYLHERGHPDDDRPRECIEAARAFALGKVDAAAKAAARDAWAAARDAASDAGWAAAGDAARDAWDAARDAAWAAKAAARAAASAAARAAARAAASAAARDAAGDAASDAAWAAAWDAASDAAWAAAWDVFSDRLLLYAQKGRDAMNQPLPDIERIVDAAVTIEEVEG